MMRRWPIRIRLTAAFTAVMALVLLTVAVLTVAHTKESLDEAITESLSYRLANLRPTAAAADPVLAGGDPDAANRSSPQAVRCWPRPRISAARSRCHPPSSTPPDAVNWSLITPGWAIWKARCG